MRKKVFVKYCVLALTIVVGGVSLLTAYFLLLSVCSPSHAARRESSNYGLQTDVTDQGGTKSNSSSYTIRQGSAGQDASIGQSDSSAYGFGQGYIYTTNTKPSTPEILEQFKEDRVTPIPWPAGWTHTSTEVMFMNVHDPDPGDVLTAQLEVRLSGESFTGVPSFAADAVDYTGTTLNVSVDATDMQHAQDYIWQARTKDLENYYSDWVSLGTLTSDYRLDLVPPTSSETLTAWATPEPAPEDVELTWEAGTDALSGVAGYNLYRSTTPGSGYAILYSNLVDLTTIDATVSLGTDYYYVLTVVDHAGGESEYSNQASAPYLILTRIVTVEAPVSGGYSGAPTDAVPGSVIKYVIDYSNLGFAVATSIEVIDKVPPNTDYLLGSATGDSVFDINYSNDDGVTFNYTPSGSNIDPDVTHIQWLCNNSSSGITREVEFSVVIR